MKGEGFLPIVAGISSRPSRLFMANSLTTILYAGHQWKGRSMKAAPPRPD